MKQTLKIGITVLVVAALAMSGIALAQTDEPADTVNEAAVTRIAERLQALVDDGVISADQAQAVAETLAGDLPRGPRGHRRGPNLGGIAEFLDLDPVEFRDALQEFDTLADLAAANGSSGQELIDFLVGHVSDRIDQAVEDGRIEEADGSEKLAEATERITEMVNGEIPDRPRPGKRIRPGGFGDPPPFDAAGAVA